MADTTDVLDKLGVGRIHRHVFICTGPKCCGEEQGQEAWDVLKAEFSQRGLGQGESVCFRTKVGCLRLCQQGPVALVYPEGTWYGEMTADRIPRLVGEHVVDGKPVEEWTLAQNPLPAPGSGGKAF
jgi:(2Fe-2S) ferredoxin